MKTITFYSYKGGVGRSLALANVANRLSEFGKKVCILDFDLEAPGLHIKFNDFVAENVSTGIVDYIHSYTSSSIVPDNIEDFVTWVYPKGTGRREPIAMIPAGNTENRSYWSKVCGINWKELFYEEESTGVEFFLNLKEQIREQLKPDFLLIDSRTGITDISGVTMSILADEVVLLAANNRENLGGITQIIKTLLVPENSIMGVIPKITFVLSRIPFFSNPKDKYKESNAKENALFNINKSLIDSGFEHHQLSKVLVIHSDPDLELKESFKMIKTNLPEEHVQHSVIGMDYLDLFEEITQGKINPEEEKKYDQFIKVESLIEKALAMNTSPARIELLNQAIALDPNAASAYGARGIAQYSLKSYEQAIESFVKACEIDPEMNVDYIWYLAACYFHVRKFNDALLAYQTLHQLRPNEYSVLSDLSSVNYALKNYDAALAYSKRAIDMLPSSDYGWNQYANVLRVLGRFEEALEAIYTALELNPQSDIATCTLAEIYAALGNDREFFKNLEQAFSFKLTEETFQYVLQEEPIYRRFYNDERLLKILDKYMIKIDWEAVRKFNS